MTDVLIFAGQLISAFAAVAFASYQIRRLCRGR